jgi:hypothetical protein
MSTDSQIQQPDSAVKKEYELKFCGESCEINAPAELPAGEYKVILKQLVEGLKAELYVAQLTGGHTYQELLDPQKTPGLYYPKPDWLIIASVSLQSSPDIPSDENWYSVTFKEEGLYAIYTYTPQNSGLWFCTPITINGE